MCGGQTDHGDRIHPRDIATEKPHRDSAGPQDQGVEGEEKVKPENRSQSLSMDKHNGALKNSEDVRGLWLKS